jgi:hypothetical protein
VDFSPGRLLVNAADFRYRSFGLLLKKHRLVVVSLLPESVSFDAL